jgi:hypothetical protein
MSVFIVEHIYKGYPMFDTVSGVEDIDLSMFKDIQTLWVCDYPEEVIAIENELRRKHAKKHEVECGK